MSRGELACPDRLFTGTGSSPARPGFPLTR